MVHCHSMNTDWVGTCGYSNPTCCNQTCVKILHLLVVRKPETSLSCLLVTKSHLVKLLQHLINRFQTIVTFYFLHKLTIAKRRWQKIPIHFVLKLEVVCCHWIHTAVTGGGYVWYYSLWNIKHHRLRYHELIRPPIWYCGIFLAQVCQIETVVKLGLLQQLNWISKYGFSFSWLCKRNRNWFIGLSFLSMDIGVKIIPKWTILPC